MLYISIPPEKLASAEALFETTSHAPLSIGGVVDPNTLELNYALEIPNMLSLLVGLDPNTVVKGLKEFPQETWPPFYTHTLFNLMVGTCLLLPLQLRQLPSYIGTLFTEKKGTELPKWLLWGAAACGPVMMLGIEFGWIFSCSGRQPWTIYGMQRTVDASTRADFVGPLFILFIILYIGLGILTVFVLRTFFKKHPLTNDLHHEGGDSRA
ncbi:cytochrome ubiquinol oxidase subunit I [Bacillus paranthracis]